MTERVLVIQMAKLGDFIQSTPLLLNIRRRWPRARLYLAAGEKSVLEAASLSPLVDEAVAVTADGPPANPGVFEAVFVLNSHVRAAGLALKADARAHYGPRLVGGRLQYAEAQRLIMALMVRRELGRLNLADMWRLLCPDSRPTNLIWPRPEQKAGGAGRAGPEGLKIGFQLGCRNHLRRWPAERFADFAAHLTAMLPSPAGFTPVILGGADEKSIGARFTALTEGRVKKPLNLMGQTDLAALGQALAGLDMLITADTGVMHLAAAVGTPVLAIFFGPAFGPETGPYGQGHIIYQTMAACAPCREGAGCRRRQCLETPDPLIAARLARALLRPDEPPVPLLLPPRHRVWRTFSDGFGQNLAVEGQPELDVNELTALAAAEAVRAALKPGYMTDPEVLRRVLKGFRKGPEAPDSSAAAAFWRQVLPAAFKDSPAAADKFIADATAAASLIIKEFYA
ncbi:MAG: glycosyltransferase family 9 protein [Candidatus Adiutrix sp.]|jgi:ADP-heptose:LPS heptosyltransferase|nr:glycosyltransferase family 9 protein [Candidatus Adiutrix sp.]